MPLLLPTVGMLSVFPPAQGDFYFDRDEALAGATEASLGVAEVAEVRPEHGLGRQSGRGVLGMAACPLPFHT